MLRKITLAALVASPLLWALPAAAQNSQQTRSVNAPVGGVLTVFGSDPCPEDTICVRANESERYRIPQDLREAEVKPQREAWAVRSQDALNTGGVGVGSCSTVGPGGGVGCFGQQADQTRAENRKRKEEQENLPLP